MKKTIKEVDLYELMHRLDEIDGQMQDIHISAYHVDMLTKEKDMIVEEIKARGYESALKHV